ncbi:helix-turn-helix domain-containing protein [Brevibacillus fortis]|uniref:Transcriptional regulator n=1 Tax=Brevibacillus fortis TaxID=2126352 RepID=A0A2P7VH25_9BACL|nr:helix-turn-helix transcriptional regulator [Brevibacillus fortis]PSJ98536.1 transcriptional regulator [Brevibacillus fortis]
MSQFAKFIGQRIRSQRKAKGLTQEQLGEKVSIPQSYIGSIERGQTYMQLDTLERILIALELNPTDVFKTYKIIESPERIQKEAILDTLHELLIHRDVQDIKMVAGFAREILTTIDTYKK